ncbi:hypothetical protein Q1W71_03270 [Flavobacterium pectinovorum]|uniref:hypothetical protein n=1 Tax=Flavobacterium TaxID=237 RepID=UPI0005AC6C90|nr:MULTISPECIES: hypothetical protein [Flavobacterium]KIQ23335.1 hypothetical protein RT99_04160 [Flavobacterium sp. MEB061]WKL48807.1 hypothetical protein Q1W71_03270 [Flavobacterium pectinovorum]
MNLDELENNRQDDQNFQDDKINKGMEIESPSTDHSITEYSEPDYGNDLSTEEINQENPQEFDNEEPEEEFDDETPDELDEDDEEFTDPNRNE